MRWACVLVAQVFPQWLEDMQKSGVSNMSSDDGLTEQLSRFRRGLLCSAALHTRNRIGDEVSDRETRTGNVGDRPAGFELGGWLKYPQLCKGVFSLQEFLRVACETGKGLPFGAPHKNAKSRGKNSEYSYSKFKSKSRRIREMFRVDAVEKLDRFETSHLDWLAVFFERARLDA